MPSALQTLQTPVLKDWIDYNDHLNDAYYLVIFTKATDTLQNHLGLTLEHIKNTGETLFTVESHLAYVQQIGVGEMVTVTSKILETDTKRMRIFHSMFNDQDELLATVEMLLICYNLESQKVTDFSPMMQKSLSLFATEHGPLTWPKNAGKGIALKRA